MTGGAPGKGTLDPRIVAVVVASALLMDLMDSAALAVSLPTVARDFGVAAVDMRLAVTAYLVTVAALVPLSSWTTNRFGAKPVFLSAMGVFTLGSIGCGMAPSFEMLILSRVVQGIGGSMMTPVGRSIVVANAPKSDLVTAMGWFTLPVILGPLLGPPLAGILIETASWRWIFFINVPIAITGMVLVAYLVPRGGGHARAPFDWAGYALLASAILAAIATLELASGGTVLAILTGVVCAVAAWLYVRHAGQIEAPVLELRLLAQPTLRAGMIAGFLLRLSVGATPFLVALLVQEAFGLSPLDTAAVTMVMALGTFTARWLVAGAVKRFRFRTAMLTFTAATALLGLMPLTFLASPALPLVAAAMAGLAVARGAALISNTTLIYCDMTGPNIAHASVMLAINQQFSMTVGITIAALAVSAAGGTASPMGVSMAFALLAGSSALGLLILLCLRPDATEPLDKPTPLKS